MKATFASSGARHDRALLGDDDVPDAALGAMVAALWGVPGVELLESRAEVVDYDLPSILTGARRWVRGRADAGEGPRPFTLFVKRVHHWRHSPQFGLLPPEVGAWAAGTVPWRAEPLVYGSDLAARLPVGLSMPRALRVEERDDETAVIWIEAVESTDRAWTHDTYRHAAHLLGRMSGSAEVAPLAGIDPQPWHVHYFVGGRIAHTVLPGLADDAVWSHPLVAPHFGGLREAILAVAGRLELLAEEFAAMPHRASHGDACPNNLLRHVADPGFTLIDFGFWRPQPVGFDLSQLLVGDVQVGRRDATDLPDLAAGCLAAYASGLAAEGLEVADAVLHRSHAVAFMLFNGLPSLPADLLAEATALERAGGLSPERRAALDHRSAQRAAIATYALDALAATEPD